MPKGGRLQLRKKRTENSSRSALFFKILLFLLLSVILYFSLAKRHFRSDNKTILTVETDGGVRIVTLDPVNIQINDYFIPGNTEIEVARNLGTWKIQSVWKLGVQEKIGGGKLLTETLTKHANIPTFVYSKDMGSGLLSTNFKSIFQAVVYPYETNLSLGDKLAIVSFALKVKNTKRVDVDLSKTSYLTNKTLVDGERGFAISASPPQSLTLVYSDIEISKNFPKFVIKDNTGRAGFSEKLSSVLEVLGGKVLLISRENKEQTYCSVRSKKRNLSTYLSKLLLCKVESEIKEGNFDVEITIGEKFVTEF